MDELKNSVADKLIQKINDLEAVKLSLEADMNSSEGEERATNEKLLKATTELLLQLKNAQRNIDGLVNN
ncbi:MAG TPA: hypothetical protein VD884_12595 [Ohtaekwangia sp.]|nr:hypothetical protein [Ohtaekwangia sp.]